jgi:hypothetical protein
LRKNKGSLKRPSKFWDLGARWGLARWRPKCWKSRGGFDPEQTKAKSKESKGKAKEGKGRQRKAGKQREGKGRQRKAKEGWKAKGRQRKAKEGKGRLD